MNKLLLVFGVCVIMAASACKKEYTCLCTTENPLGGNDIEVPYQIEKSSKKKAEEACQQKEDEENSSSSAPPTSCQLE